MVILLVHMVSGKLHFAIRDSCYGFFVWKLKFMIQSALWLTINKITSKIKQAYESISLMEVSEDYEAT